MFNKIIALLSDIGHEMFVAGHEVCTVVAVRTNRVAKIMVTAVQARIDAAKERVACKARRVYAKACQIAGDIAAAAFVYGVYKVASAYVVLGGLVIFCFLIPGPLVACAALGLAYAYRAARQRLEEATEREVYYAYVAAA